GLMCRVLGVSRAGYYDWCRRGPSARSQQDAQLRHVIRVLYHANKQAYGSPRIHRALRDQAVYCGRKRVVRLMRQEGLRARHKGPRLPKSGRSSAAQVAANWLARRFTPTEPNRIWVGDVTACWTGEGWLYLAVLLDL